MASIMTYRTAEEMSVYVTGHLESICQAVRQSISDSDRQQALLNLLKLAQDNVQDEAMHPTTPSSRAASAYEPQINQYMQSLLSKNTRNTLYLIQEFIRQGIPLNDIYVEILAESMRRVGDLWHTAKITVDTEHYCTSITQTAMAQLYPLLFEAPRKDRTLLCACPGTELHEMGARMVADIFENDGWDSVYLGAAVPENAMLEAIRTNHPDLIALSVAMPQHLLDCRDLILKIRKQFPDVKIAVGGNAFRSTDHIWSQWPVDFYTDDARELLIKANTAFSC